MGDLLMMVLTVVGPLSFLGFMIFIAVAKS